MEINIDQFKFSMPINIRWNDMDALGHVNNVYYFEYFQVARGIYMPTVSENWDWTKFMFVIAHIECNYIQELSMLHKKPEIKVRASRLGNKSRSEEHTSELQSRGHLVCRLLLEKKKKKKTEPSKQDTE